MKKKSGILSRMAGGPCWPMNCSRRCLNCIPASPGQSFTGSAPGMVDASGEAPVARRPAIWRLRSGQQALRGWHAGHRRVPLGRRGERSSPRWPNQHGEHADGALYWKAYAEDKLGQSNLPGTRARSCAAAIPGAAGSTIAARWSGAARQSGKPVQIDPGESDDVKLLALNAMMRQNEPRRWRRFRKF
jgi:hypothetical protein